MRTMKSLSLLCGLVLLLVACNNDRDPAMMMDSDAGAIEIDAGNMEEDANAGPMCLAPEAPYGTAVCRVLEPFELQTCA